MTVQNKPLLVSEFVWNRFLFSVGAWNIAEFSERFLALRAHGAVTMEFSADSQAARFCDQIPPHHWQGF